MKKIAYTFKAITGLALASTALLLGSCTADPDSPGLEYMPDMYRSPAIEPYVDYGELRGRVDEEQKLKPSALVPPKGAIPFFGTDKEEVSLMLPYHRLPNVAFKQTHDLQGFDFTTEDSYAAAIADANPLKLTADNYDKMMARAKEVFNQNCAHCHGEKGDGQGPMVTSGAYAGVPDYKDKMELGDGQIFYSIYYGKGQMGAHGPTVSKKDIWGLVHYIRSIQNPDYKNMFLSGGAVMMAPSAGDVSDSTKVENTQATGQH